MAERKRVGLFYESYSNLPAFVIYIQNVVKALCLAEDRDKPLLVILHLPDSPIDEIKEIGYPYIKFYQLKNVYEGIIKRAVNRISRCFFGANLIPFIDKEFPKDLDVIFPYNFRTEAEYITKKILWKPDFQEFHLPQYFKLQELIDDKKFLDRISVQGYDLVLSSEDALRDYVKRYPTNNNKIHIWKFASFVSQSISPANALIQEYRLENGYFLVANQFWPHKNHLNVVKALRICVESGCKFKIVFTGKQSSQRDPELYEKLKFYIDTNGLNNYVVFTGFIDRNSQLGLMKSSLGIIQPSLFEGWSTVIEDCKAINQFVFASDISVNREQIKENVAFFNPHDYKELANLMSDYYYNPKTPVLCDYRQDLHRYCNDIVETIKNR